MRRKSATRAAAGAVVLGLVLSGGVLAAEKVMIASGTVPSDTGGFPWEIRAQPKKVQGIPGLCLETDHSWDAAGTSFGNISTRCVAGSAGGRFTLHAGACHGVVPVQTLASLGESRIRKLALALDPRARRVKIVFQDGAKVSVGSRRAPKSIRRPVRFAWHFDQGAAFVERIAAYGPKRKGKRRIVGRFKQGSNC